MTYTDDPYDTTYGDPVSSSGGGKSRCNKKWCWIGLCLTAVIIISVSVGVAVSNKNKEFTGSPDQIQDLIVSNSPDQDVFDDPDSYQSQALQWSLDNSAGVGANAERILQRYALASIFYATYSQRTAWTDHSFGKGQPVLPWVNERGWLTFDDECDWFGLECNEEGKIEEIDLANNILTGKFPDEVTLLASSLKVLDLYNNYIYNVGDDGNKFLGELTAMEQLYYGSTSFQYEGIPTYIGKLTNLIEYDCSYTLYFGELRPEVFAPLTSLEYLYIGGNSFNSSLPTVLSELPNLLYFYAEYADVIGDLSFMLDMPQIFELWVDRNPLLTGPIYSEIGQLETLESFSVTRCGLTGTIPTELGNLVEMQQMWFYDNDLRGQVPSELGRLTNMKLFEVEANPGLQGIMPQAVCDNVAPRGVLADLEADCLPSDNLVCNCCTCCGAVCADEQTQGQAGSAEQGSNPQTNSGGGTGQAVQGPNVDEGTSPYGGVGGGGGGGQRRVLRERRTMLF